MDIDAMGKHMPGLLEFKKRVEELLAGADVGAGTAAEMLNSRIDELNTILTDLGEHVAALQVSKDEAESFSERLHTMLEWFEANREGIDVLLSIGDDLKTAGDGGPGPVTVTGPSATAPLTLDQVNATSKPQLAPVGASEIVIDAAAPSADPAPADETQAIPSAPADETASG